MILGTLKSKLSSEKFENESEVATLEDEVEALDSAKLLP